MANITLLRISTSLCVFLCMGCVNTNEKFQMEVVQGGIARLNNETGEVCLFGSIEGKFQKVCSE